MRSSTLRVVGGEARPRPIVSLVGASSHGPSLNLVIYKEAAESLVGALRHLGDEAPRLLVIGGAGSLEVAPGVRLVDTPEFPAMYKEESLAQCTVGLLPLRRRHLVDLRQPDSAPAAGRAHSSRRPAATGECRSSPGVR